MILQRISDRPARDLQLGSRGSRITLHRISFTVKRISNWGQEALRLGSRDLHLGSRGSRITLHRISIWGQEDLRLGSRGSPFGVRRISFTVKRISIWGQEDLVYGQEDLESPSTGSPFGDCVQIKSPRCVAVPPWIENPGLTVRSP
jgi:hypothetical protein